MLARVVLSVLLAMAVGVATAPAQTYPSRAITMVAQ